MNKPALTFVADTLPALILPATPTPPATMIAPVVVLVLGVTLTISKFCRLCAVTGLALLTVALVKSIQYLLVPSLTY